MSNLSKAQKMKRDISSTDGITLYRVDPKRLSIKVLHTISSRYETTTTHENFMFEGERKINLSTLAFPCELEGVFYFKTKDEALNFIKLQVGM